MKRATLATLVLLVAALPATAFAEPRPVTVNGSSLQTFFATNDPTVSVAADQITLDNWTSTVSGVVLVTLKATQTPDAADNHAGMYNSYSGQLAEIFGVGHNTAVENAVVQFQAGSQIAVTMLSDASNDSFSNIPYTGFGFFIRKGADPADYGYTQDSRNGGTARALVFAGEGSNAGSFWVCLEDGRNAGQANAEDNDFDDAILLVSAANPSPVQKSTWAAVKARFR